MRPVRFSTRTNWDTSETAWAQELTTRRKQGLPIYDLTAANPTQCGFTYDDRLLDALRQPAALQYDPQPRGLIAARESVCSYYCDHVDSLSPKAQFKIHPRQVLLTTSSSEAYSFLFRLLCDPGDEVLIAQPSYPLFDFLAMLDDVKLISYPLFYDYGWHLDLHGLRLKISPKTRAIVVVHPNNPTGHFTHEADRKALESLCSEFGLALIVDEVFLDYSFTNPSASFATGEHPALTFVLSGLSKAAGLPQMKLSWIAAFGPEPDLSAALNRLEVIADTFLSLSSPLQLALPTWLQQRGHIQQQILARVKANLGWLDEVVGASDLIERLRVDAGWYAILRAPALQDAEQLALRVLRQAGVAIHPGSFFGMAGEGYFVVSLLLDEAAFHQATILLIELLIHPLA
jgi:aspartate/methionine/tyrosine aminotransferase